MLNENLSKYRKERGLTQEALAIKLNVVRQTVSKWEKGIAVPDANMLCRIAAALEVPVSLLLGDAEQKTTDGAAIANALALINEQLAVRRRRVGGRRLFCALLFLVIVALAAWIVWNGAASRTTPPERIEISNVSFCVESGTLRCSFVPSADAEEIGYTVFLYPFGESTPTVTAPAKYENGFAVAVFGTGGLSPYHAYTAILQIDGGGEKRNLALADNIYVSAKDNASSWNPLQK